MNQPTLIKRRERCRHGSVDTSDGQNMQGGAAALELQQRPVLELLLAVLWPQLHALCLAGASGRFLQARYDLRATPHSRARPQSGEGNWGCEI